MRDVSKMEFGNPRRLFTRPERSAYLDVSPDGQHFLLLQPELPPAPSAITYISGWLDAITAKGGR